jgi:hypothetical protein
VWGADGSSLIAICLASDDLERPMHDHLRAAGAAKFPTTDTFERPW